VTILTIARRSASYHWRTNLAILLGVAAAVAVLAGALLVGDSVRGSLRDIALGRLGRTDHVVASTGFFTRDLEAYIAEQPGVTGAASLIVANGFVTHEPSGRRAGSVLVYGVDEAFWKFHGLQPPDGVYVSPALAAETGAQQGDVLLTRLQRPSEIPLESLFARKEETGRTVRLTLAGVLPPERLGEFALQPQQAAVRAMFAPLRRIQRDLGVEDQVNTILVAGDLVRDRFRAALRIEHMGVRVRMTDDERAISVESASGIIGQSLDESARAAGKSYKLEPLPIFTYLANVIRKGDRSVPYSLITAIDLRVLTEDTRPAVSAAPPDAIVLNDWTARELGASPGDRIDVDYYLWDPAAGLLTKSASFTLTAIVPIAGLAADRRLAPEYPGISGSASLADWDPPFPLDLGKVRDQDEKYWDAYRTTAKAFIQYERGRELWQTRYGAATSLRFAPPTPPGGKRGFSSPEGAREAVAAVGGFIRSTISPQAMGMSSYPARQLALEASTGATDFGQYFTYFSFFLVVSALLLTVLFFKLGVEGRLKQIGIMRAAGYTVAVLRRMLIAEAALLAIVGALLGVAGAVAYARIIIHGLTTWWVGAVGTDLLRLHVSPLSLVIGAAAGVAAAIICVAVSLRTVARLSPRALLTAQGLENAGGIDAGRPRRNRRLALGFSVVAVTLIAVGFSGRIQAGAFFGAGAALLVASLLGLASWLRNRDARLISGRGAWAVARLGFRSAAFRPARSVLSAALIASAAFIIVSVEAFRRGGGELTQDPASGTGGYALLARAELPMLQNPNEPAGREAMLIQAPELAAARFTRFRVRPGQDASCLNLYRPTNPTIVAPVDGFIDSNRFSFSASLAETDAERANPWLLLRKSFDDGSVPVIADATSLQYVLHVGVGDTMSIDLGATRPLVVRFVGALRDSVLQGELIMAEEQFVTLFPGQPGYRMFLLAAPSVTTLEQARALAGVVEKEFQPFGVDAVTTADRLDEFHRVENTYLSTFQALGSLGLLLGTVGLATVMFRNVLERRRELALLRAVGYNASNVTQMIVAESVLLLGTGLAAGALCAAVAIAPAWLGHGGRMPGSGLIVLLLAVVVAGLLSSFVATRAALTGRMLDALRAE
jgi:ABC-type lipoprotein release transport system permease subunit